MYPKDTVIFTSDMTCEVIKSNLNSDLLNLTRWFSENKLALNLKKGKTEFVLYGTSKKLSKSWKVHVKVYGTSISEAESFEYLGIEMNQPLTYNKHIDRTMKKASTRVKLLPRIRQSISPCCRDN